MAQDTDDTRGADVLAAYPRRRNTLTTLREQPWKILVVAALLAFPLASLVLAPGNSFWVSLLIEVFVFAIAAISFDLLFGYTGLLSFGHALFFGGGAYTVAISMETLGQSYLVGALLALVVVPILAVIVGAVSLRLTGVYFALITLAFAQLVYQIVLQFNDITGGVNGISGLTLPPVAGITLDNAYVAYYIAFLVLVAVYLALKRIVNSPFGRILQGIRENEDRIEMAGINTYRYKLASFVLSGFLGGVAGILYPLFLDFISPTLLYWVTTGDILLMTLIGGAGSVWGPMVGAAFFLMLEHALSGIIDRWRLILGLVFVLFVLFLPSGFAGLVEGERATLLDHVRAWREEEDATLSDLVARIGRGGKP